MRRTNRSPHPRNSLTKKRNLFFLGVSILSFTGLVFAVGLGDQQPLAPEANGADERFARQIRDGSPSGVNGALQRASKSANSPSAENCTPKGKDDKDDFEKVAGGWNVAAPAKPQTSPESPRPGTSQNANGGQVTPTQNPSNGGTTPPLASTDGKPKTDSDPSRPDSGKTKTDSDLHPVSNTTTAAVGESPPSSAVPQNYYYGGPTHHTGTDSTKGSITVDIAKAADNARGQELLSNVLGQQSQKAKAIAADTKALQAPYYNLSRDEFLTHAERAQKALQEQEDALAGAAPQDLGKAGGGELVRHQLNIANAAALAGAAIDLLKQKPAEEQTPSTPGQLFPGLGNGTEDSAPGAALSAAGGAALDAAKEIFGIPPSYAPSSAFKGQGEYAANSPAPEAASSADQLAQRTVQLAGLSGEEYQKVKDELALVETATVKAKNGKMVKIDILHNGYLLGSSKTGIDCSSLVSEAIPSDVRAGRLTTLDFTIIWSYVKFKEIPKPPTLAKGREGQLVKISHAFNSVNIWQGEALVPGDLLVFRIPWEPIGHVFVIKDYRADNHMATVVEASQSAGGIRERPFRVTLGPNSTTVRPGIFALRLKPKSNEGCTYADDRKPGRGNSAENISFLGLKPSGEIAQLATLSPLRGGR